MTGKQMIKLYLEQGWTYIHTRGSHYKMKKNGRIELIPYHTKELKTGLEKSLLKKLKEVG